MVIQPLKIAATALALFCAALPMRAQLPTISDVDRGGQARAAIPLPKWDVAVVKPHPPEDMTMSWQMTADSMSLKNLTLEQIICSGWNVNDYQLSGLTGWMKSSRFDLTAKVSDDDLDVYKKLNGEQRREMLQKLLIERFQLKVHTETKVLPVYNLVVDKGGSKLKPSTSIAAPSSEEWKANSGKYRKGAMTMGPGLYEGTGVPLHSLVSQLSNAVGKPVHDATGLTGDYDITLHFRREETTTSDNSEAPSVFSAVQEQLGLKLVAAKAPVETLVVDAAQKPESD